MIKFHCEYCGAHMEAEEAGEHADTVPCPKCGMETRILALRQPSSIQREETAVWVWRGVIAGLLLIAFAFFLWRGWKYVDVLPDLAEVFGSLAAAIGFLALVVCLYFLPLIVAVRSKHRNTEAIVVINILLGWTFVFWVLALAWAVHRDINGRPG